MNEPKPSTLNTLAEMLAEYKKTIDVLKSEIKTLIMQRDFSQEECRRARGEVKLAGFSEVAPLPDSVQQMRVEISILKDRLADCAQQKNPNPYHTEAVMAQKDHIIKNQSEANEWQAKKISELGKVLEESRRDFAHGIELKNSVIDSLVSEKERLNRALDELRTENAKAADNTVPEAKNKLEAFWQGFADCNKKNFTTLKQKDDFIDSLESRLKTYSQQVDELRNERDALRIDNKAAHRTIAELRNENCKLGYQVGARPGERTLELENSLAKLRKEKKHYERVAQEQCNRADAHAVRIREQAENIEFLKKRSERFSGKQPIPAWPHGRLCRRHPTS